eukprot:CAMPEP_0172890322 /NCGR_PEP_ID=MMETSP1075-20121228/140943_1 /TAXON_ID=2916 /ORGANISM="Ceratium fusus, Strain PA161109" /LENGTH=91 /DNA_ID=CAMNT_0013744555 /DNA_START=237 /DNA_END=512 /DNA_ORIENTATION=-
MDLTKAFITCWSRDSSRCRAGMRSRMSSLAMLDVPKLCVDFTECVLATLNVSASFSFSFTSSPLRNGSGRPAAAVAAAGTPTSAPPAVPDV